MEHYRIQRLYCKDKKKTQAKQTNEETKQRNVSWCWSVWNSIENHSYGLYSWRNSIDYVRIFFSTSSLPSLFKRTTKIKPVCVKEEKEKYILTDYASVHEVESSKRTQSERRTRREKIVNKICDFEIFHMHTKCSHIREILTEKRVKRMFVFLQMLIHLQSSKKDMV